MTGVNPMGFINPRRDLKPRSTPSTPAIPGKASNALPEQPPAAEPSDTAKVVTLRMYGRQRSKVELLAKRWGLTEFGLGATIRRIIDEFQES